MANRFSLPVPEVQDASGGTGAGWKLEFFESGTSTPLDTYSDNALITVNVNPVVADAAGRFTNMFLKDQDYKVTLSNSSDVQQWSADPVHGGNSGDLVIATGSTTARSLAERFTDVINVKDDGSKGDNSTDDGTNIALSITRALAAGSELYWPDGTYLTTASIASLHSIRHFGPGVIKRGTDLFKVDPIDGDTNIIYVAASGGSDTDDGLSSSEPLATVQAAMDLLKNYGPTLEGIWRVQFAAGTWTEGGLFKDGLGSSKRIQFYGPSVSGGVPTAIFDGTGATNAWAFQFRSGNFIHVKDIKGQDWLHSSGLSGPVAGQDVCDLFTENVHATNCKDGVRAQNGTRLNAKGGIIDTCTRGIACVAGVEYTIGSGATQLSEGPEIKNCTQDGILAQESHGHADWTTLDNNDTNLHVISGSCHLLGSDIKNGNVGATMERGGVLFDDPATPNAWTNNTVRWRQRAYGGVESLLTSAVTEYRVGIDLATYAHTGTTARTVIATPYTIPDDFFVEESRRLRIVVHGEYTTNTGTVNIGIDFGGSIMEQLVAVGTPTGGIGFIAEFNIWATGGSSQDLSSVLLHGTGSVRTSNLTRVAVMTSGTKAVQVTAEMSVSGDTVTIEQIEVFLTG